MTSWREGRDVQGIMAPWGVLWLLLVDTETPQVNQLLSEVEDATKCLLCLTAEQKRCAGIRDLQRQDLARPTVQSNWPLDRSGALDSPADSSYCDVGLKFFPSKSGVGQEAPVRVAPLAAVTSSRASRIQDAQHATRDHDGGAGLGTAGNRQPPGFPPATSARYVPRPTTPGFT